MITAERDGWTQLRYRIWERDRGCIAVRRTLIGVQAAPDECRDKWGIIIGYDALEYLELDHVKEQPMMGRKAPDDEAHLVLLCPHHHARWATSHRAEEREYLARLYPNIWQSVA